MQVKKTQPDESQSTKSIRDNVIKLSDGNHTIDSQLNRKKVELLTTLIKNNDTFLTNNNRGIRLTTAPFCVGLNEKDKQAISQHKEDQFNLIHQNLQITQLIEGIQRIQAFEEERS
jgi:hypothetical protein